LTRAALGIVLGLAAMTAAAQQEGGDLGMRAGWGITELTDEVVQTAKQLGVRDIVIYGGPASGRFPGTNTPLDKPRAGYEDYLALRRRLEANGLRLAAIEGGFVHNPKFHDVVYGGPKRDDLIEELLAELRDMGRAGVPIYGYHWMPLLVWRGEPARIRGNAEATAFDLATARSVVDRESCNDLRERLGWGLMTCEATPEPVGRAVSEEEMWSHLEYWIKKVTPVAEEAGIRLGIHPDDSPVDELAGVPRLLRNHGVFKRLIEIYPSDSNAIEFCQGTFSEMKDGVYDAIRYFGERNKILYVHFRNVSGRVPSFHEEFINTGYVDMHRALKIYEEVGYEGVLIDDHCPMLTGDSTFPGNLGGYRSRIFALGYIQGLIEAVAKAGR
jgi:mannonate dehydratase